MSCVYQVNDKKAVRQADGDNLKRAARVVVAGEHQPVLDPWSGAGRVRIDNMARPSGFTAAPHARRSELEQRRPRSAPSCGVPAPEL